MANVLLVEDNPDQREIRKLILEKAGHRVTTADCPEEACRVFPEAEPQVVLMDLRMPALQDGLGLIRGLRALSSSVKILVLSGWATDLAHLPEGKMVTGCLQKPFRSADLLSILEKIALWLMCLIGQLVSFRPAMELKVKVIPRSSRSEVAGYLSDGTLKVKVAAPPEKGKANEELCALLGRKFGVPARNVEILSGRSNSLKRVRIST